MTRTIFIAALALAVTLSAVSAQAQAPRTGSDSNPCSFAAPCYNNIGGNTNCNTAPPAIGDKIAPDEVRRGSAGRLGVVVPTDRIALGNATLLPA
jgi:hypothetical protein